MDKGDNTSGGTEFGTFLDTAPDLSPYPCPPDLSPYPRGRFAGEPVNGCWHFRFSFFSSAVVTRRFFRHRQSVQTEHDPRPTDPTLGDGGDPLGGDPTYPDPPLRDPATPTRDGAPQGSEQRGAPLADPRPEGDLSPYSLSGVVSTSYRPFFTRLNSGDDFTKLRVEG